MNRQSPIRQSPNRQPTNRHIDTFHFEPGTVVARKYEVVNQIGAGWEGEVYRVRERGTNIERAAKFFFPHRNRGRKASTVYAKKLYKLRECPILIPYHVQEEIIYSGQSVVCLVSDYVEGELLDDFLARQPGKRLSVFQALHLLHALVVGIESIHRRKDYHGDLHGGNIIVRKYGLGFDLKVLDLFHWGAVTRDNIQDDVVDLVKLFYQSIGGARTYRTSPGVVKEICNGLKRSQILKKFPSVSKLRSHLETLQWS